MTLEVGKKIGRWTPLEFSPQTKVDGKRVPPKWLCTCECGTKRWVSAHHLIAGRTRSCGCDRAEQHKRDMAITFGAGNLKRRPLV